MNRKLLAVYIVMIKHKNGSTLWFVCQTWLQISDHVAPPSPGLPPPRPSPSLRPPRPHGGTRADLNSGGPRPPGPGIWTVTER